jgi:hypothetical protein
MGQAKLRREGALMLYHHTSTLRTNLIWMSGVIELEGKSEGAVHPVLGEIKTTGTLRRSMSDFPPLAWFTTEVSVPKCLLQTSLAFVDNETGKLRGDLSELDERLARAISLTHVALGFPAGDIPARPWQEHPGYVTAEGKELNETARDAGDDPDDWYVSDEPVDVMKVTEFWHDVKKGNTRRMVRHPAYVADIHRMVKLCRTQSGVHIPPSWVGEHNLNEYAKMLREKSGTPIPRS